MTYKISNDRKTLTICVDEAERQELREWETERAGFENENMQSDLAMHDFLEPLTCNSELEWIPEGMTGDLTSAPMLGIIRHDNWTEEGGEVEERWAFMDYQVRSVLEDLRDKGEAVFIS